MKALPMLDHVMLWVARIFTLIFALKAAFSLISESNRHAAYFDPLVGVALIGLAWVCFFCTYLSKYFICRLFLSISSMLLLIFIIQMMYLEIREFWRICEYLKIPIVPKIPAILVSLLEPILSLVGLFAMLWIAYRPFKNRITSV